jgi:hypothetical protein
MTTPAQLASKARDLEESYATLAEEIEVVGGILDAAALEQIDNALTRMRKCFTLGSDRIAAAVDPRLLSASPKAGNGPRYPSPWRGKPACEGVSDGE